MAGQRGRKPQKVLKNRIHEIRNARGLTVEELAAKADLSPSYISLMASGDRNISLKNLEKLANALNCSPEDLIGTDTRTNADILNVWSAIPAERRDLALQVLQSFTNPSVTTDLDSDSVKAGAHPKKRPRNQR